MRLFYALGLAATLLTLPAAAQQSDPAPDKPAQGFPLGLTVRVNPLGVLNKARAQAELGLGRQFGLGVVGAYYYGAYSGPKVEPYLRFYTSPRRFGHGLYVQAKLSAGRFSTNFRYDRIQTIYRADGFLEDVDIESPYGRVPKTFRTLGPGAGAGYQFRAGRQRRFVIDLYAGLQWLPRPEQVGSYTEVTREASGRRTQTEWTTDEADLWYVTGPGAVFNAMAGLGYTLGGGQYLGPQWRERLPRRRPAPPTDDDESNPIRKAGLPPARGGRQAR